MSLWYMYTIVTFLWSVRKFMAVLTFWIWCTLILPFSFGWNKDTHYVIINPFNHIYPLIIQPSIHLSVHSSIYLSIHPFICPFIHLFTHTNFTPVNISNSVNNIDPSLRSWNKSVTSIPTYKEAIMRLSHDHHNLKIK